MTRFAQALVTAFLASIAFPFFVAAAEPKTAGGRIGIGDLVEYTTGMGPMLGEVINGPDASNFYLLLVPSAGEVPVNGSKLRRIQLAGTANAPFKPGDVVDIHGDSNSVTRGSVVKVNGKWCQVEAPGMVGWAECTGLRVAKGGDGTQGAAPEQTNAPVAPSSETPAKAAPSTLVGTYENADGKAVIEFLAGGKAYFSFHGITGDCTHSGNARKVTVTCDAEDTVFTVNSDGSLAGPPDSFVARMKKKP